MKLNPRIAHRYAKSLVDIAKEQNKQEAVLADMRSFLKVSKENREFSAVINSPVIKSDKKLKIIEAIFSEQFDVLTTKFMELVVEKNREAGLIDIAEAYISQYNEQQKIKTVKLTTAYEMNDDVRKSITWKDIIFFT